MKKGMKNYNNLLKMTPWPNGEGRNWDSGVLNNP
jgi:hypothetical protein